MVAIAEKLAAAMSGFWWALDDEERRLLIGVTVWTLAVVCQAVVSRHAKEREREELVRDVAEEILSRGR